MPDEFPPYVPMPSLGHELGLMFGFFSLCLAVMAAYVVVWRSESSIQLRHLSPINSTIFLYDHPRSFDRGLITNKTTEPYIKSS